jgi:hypothetical protein
MSIEDFWGLVVLIATSFITVTQLFCDIYFITTNPKTKKAPFKGLKMRGKRKVQVE